jgi:5,10-methenyltetrahydromethanopterin hydrogenase
MNIAELPQKLLPYIYTCCNGLALAIFAYGFLWLTDAVVTMRRANADFAKFVQAEVAVGVSWQLMAAIIWWATP